MSFISYKIILQIIFTTFIAELNTLKQRPQKSLVKIVSDESAVTNGNPSGLVAINVPSLADHPLVSGKRYTKVRVAPIYEGMDRKSSGVMGNYKLFY